MAETYIYRGKHYTIAELAKLSGYSYGCIYARLGLYSDIEDVMRVPKKTLKGEKFLYKGKMYRLRELAKFSKVGISSLTKRIKEGWPVDIAVELPTLCRLGKRAQDEIKRNIEKVKKNNEIRYAI